jgi:hypothetical protein
MTAVYEKALLGKMAAVYLYVYVSVYVHTLCYCWSISELPTFPHQLKLLG